MQQITMPKLQQVQSIYIKNHRQALTVFHEGNILKPVS